MKTKHLFFSFLFFILCIKSFSQNATAKVAGIVLDENNKPIESVNVSYLSKSSVTDKNGFYTITVPANQKVVLVFTHVALKNITATLQLKPDEEFEYHVVMSDKAEQLSDVVITSSRRRV
ncbi:MAG TPA: carboxypeptidase-like regulatory domain-containing protein, partial [Flavobacterium sp.]|nr:carboxypeptidase-like regulatory domain-containing protein [Flavobacterium sp.]